MPVSVHVPIRIRTDARSLAEDQKVLSEALGRALGRALGASRTRVLEPRGSYVGVRFDPPELRWTGEGAGDVPPELRAAIESRIADLVLRVAEGAGVFDLARASAEAKLPFEDEAAELVDRRKILPDGYALASYGGKSQGGVVTFEPEVLVVERGPKKKRTELVLPHAKWRVFHDPKDTLEPLLDAAWVLGLRDDQGNYPVPLGALYLHSTGQLVMVIWDVNEHGHWGIEGQPILLTGLTRETWRDDVAELVEAPAELPAGGIYYVDGVRAATDEGARKAVLLEIRGADLEKECRRIPKPDQLTSEQWDAWLKQRIEARYAAQAAADASATSYMIFRTPKQERFVIRLSLDASSWGYVESVPLLPLAEVSSKPVGKAADKGAKPGVKKGAKGAGAGAPGEGGAEPGGFVLAPEGGEGLTTDPRASKFPPIRVGGSEPLELGPLNGEASLTELGADGDAIRKLMEQIAYRLEMPMGEYPGAFAVAAAIMLGTRAIQVGKFAVDQPSATKNVAGGRGNLGKIQFDPLPSPGIQLLRHLAATCPYITALRESIVDVYKRDRAKANLIRGTYQGEWSGWAMRFYEALAPQMKDAVGFGIFVRGCQTLLLQLLRTSKEAILQRKNSPTYPALFEYVVLTQLTGVEKLLAMKTKLDSFALSQSPSVSGVVRGALRTWRDARRAMGLTTGGMPTVEGPSAATPDGLLHMVDGQWVVQDEHGYDWTMADLDSAIALRRGTAEAIDPLVKQIVDLPDVMPKLRAQPTLIKKYLADLLDQMLKNNEEQTRKTVESHVYAFRASKISEDLPQATIPYTSYALGGIHKVFHDTIGDAFHGDTYYGMGIDALFSAELGREAISSFFEFTGVLFLSIVCAPFGMVAGAAYAVERRERALERMQLYHSLIDPELVASYAELELELFMAELEVAMSILPAGGKLVRGGLIAGRAMIKQGVRKGLQAAGRRLLKEMLEQLERELKYGLVVAFAREIVQQKMMELVMQQVLEPVIAELGKEMMATGPVGVTSSESSFGGTSADTLTKEDLQELPISSEDPPDEEPP